MGSLVLFTRDLRVHDQPALAAAARAGGSCVPLFVFGQELLQRSPNRARFLMQSLADLDGSLTRLGSPLVVREGDAVARTLEVVADARVDEVHLTDDVSGLAQRRERALREALAAQGVELHVHPGNAVVGPGDVAPLGKQVYSVFTPYHRAWAQVPRRAVLAPPSRLVAPEADLDPGARPDPGALRPTRPTSRPVASRRPASASSPIWLLAPLPVPPGTATSGSTSLPTRPLAYRPTCVSGA